MKPVRLTALLLGSTALIGLSTALPACATDDWLGATSTDWNLAANWNPTGVPGNGDDVTINTTSPNATTLTTSPILASLVVGVSANGVLTLSAGANLSTTTLTLGSTSSGFGAATVTGVGAKIGTGAQTIGAAGTGDLEFHTNAIGSFSAATLGASAGGHGTVVVTDNAQWSGASAIIGDAGRGDLLVTQAQAGATTMTLGNSAGGLGNMVITGLASNVLAPTLVVGLNGQGIVEVHGGAALRSLTQGVVGERGTAANSVLVEGDQSFWQVGALTVGDRGQGTVNLQNKGTIESTSTVLGKEAGSQGNILVQDNGTQWRDSGTLDVGLNGHGALTVSHLGSATVMGETVVGNNAGSFGDVHVTGVLSQLNTGVTVVGGDGTAHVTIDDQGSISSGDVAAGNNVDGVATININDLNSVWSSDSFTVGEGGKATLTVGNNANLQATNGITVAALAGSTGVINIGGADGAPAAVPGFLSTPSILFGAGNGTLNFNHTSNGMNFGPALAGNGIVNQNAGVTKFTTDSSGFSGTLNVNGGTALQNAATGASVIVRNGGSFGGNSFTTRGVSVNNGGNLLGVSGQTLGMDSLALSATSNLNVTLGATTITQIFDVIGNVTLDGVLNITAAPGFGNGVYRLMNYGGTLTDNGLDIGTTPAGSVAGDFTVETATSHQVDLVVDNTMVSPPPPPPPPVSPVDPGPPAPPAPPPRPTIQFWDGAVAHGNGQIEGGDGVWDAATPNFTDASGASVDPFLAPNFAVFTGAPGKVTVSNAAGEVSLTGAQFAADGYVVDGDPITLAGSGLVPIRVGDGTAASSDFKATISAKLVGAAGLEKTDFGTLILTGANTYAGGTLISAGTLVGSATSFGAGNILNNAALVIDQPTDAEFVAAIDGTGVFTKRGAGSLNYTGTGALSGATTVAAGRLAVNGSLINSPVTVLSGATLGGNGTVGGVAAQSGAIVAPGNSIGTLHVHGDYAQASGSTYQADLTSGGSSDLVEVLGAATIASGAILKVSKTDLGAYVLGTRSTLLTAAGGVTGKYTLAGDLSLTAFVGLVDHYDANNVYLDVAKVRSFASAGANANEVAVGQGLDSLPMDRPLAAAIAMMPSFDMARGAFGQLSGEAYASAKSTFVEDGRFVRDAALNRVRSATGAPGSSPATGVAYDADGSQRSVSADAPGPVFWGQAFGSWGSADGDAETASAKTDTTGVFLGGDAPVADGAWRLGALGGYSQTKLDIDGRASHGTLDTYDLGAYAGGKVGEVSLRGGAAYSWHALRMTRSVAFPGFTDKLAGKDNATSAQVFAEAARRFTVAPNLALEPFAAIAHVAVRTDGFTEQGGGAALTNASSTTNVTFTTLGLRGGSIPFALGETMATVRGAVGWRHAYGDVTPVNTAAFTGGSNFLVAGTPIGKDDLTLEAGLDLALHKTMDLGLSYAGQVASGAQDHALKVNFSWRF